MTCAHLHEQLWDYLYGLLDDAEAQPLREHLAACPDCQEGLRVAQVQQKLLARAAHAVREVPLFTLPGDEVAVPAAVPQVEVAPAVLPFVAPAALPRRAPLRRWWPAWTAAAAVLIAGLFGNHLYQDGLHDRRIALVEARKQVDNVNAQFAALQLTLEQNLQRQAEAAKKTTLHMTVAGSPLVHAEVSNSYRVTARDPDGKPQKGEVQVQVLDDKSKGLLYEAKQTIVGECQVVVPQNLKSWSGSANLVVNCQSAAGNAQIVEPLVQASPAYVSHIALNKAAFAVNELAFFRTLTLDRYSHKPPAEPLALRFSLINEDGKVVMEKLGQTGPGGISGGEFALTPSMPTGPYTLQVAALDPAKATIVPQTRRLDIIRDAGPIVEVDMDRLTVLRAGQKGNLPIRVRRPDGTPAANEAVIANINTDPQASTPPTPGGGKYQNNKGQQQFNQFRLNEQGEGVLPYEMPTKLSTNNAVLEVELFEGKGNRRAQQTIPVVPSQLAVDFFPEGGDLIAGVPNRVYYRVRSVEGEPVSPEGRVLVLSNKDVLLDAEPGQAAGSFTFVPDAKETYSARITGPDGVIEIAKPFQRLAIKPSGVILNVPQPVLRADEACKFIVHNAGEPRTLVVLAVCRGQLVGHEEAMVKDQATAITMPLIGSADGLVRLTVYEAAGRVLNPLAERLLFRVPAQRLDVSVAQLTGKQSFVPGQHVYLGLKATNEKGQGNPVWYLAAVSDDRFQADRRERPLGAHFHMAAELNMPEDLDHANIAMIDTAENRHGLDLFLGTQGWRRFTSEPAAQVAQTKTAGKPGTAAAPLYFHRENNTLANLRANAEGRYQLTAAQLRLEAGQQQAQLRAEKDQRLQALAGALADVSQFEQAPREWFRLALGALALVLVLGGSLCLLWSLARVLRRVGSPSLAFGGAFACLALCLVLQVAGRLLPQVQDGRPNDPLANLLNDRPWVESTAGHQIAWLRAPGESPAGHFAALGRSHDDDKNFGEGGKTVIAEGRAKGGMNRDQTLTAKQAEAFSNFAYSQSYANEKDQVSQYTPELAGRFKTAEELQNKRSYADGKGDKKKAAKENPVDTTKGKDVPGLALLDTAREYVHTRQEPWKDFQDTVLWHPALFTADGNDEIAFDLSHNTTTYRVLFFANSPDGRLGFFEGRLEVRPAARK